MRKLFAMTICAVAAGACAGWAHAADLGGPKTVSEEPMAPRHSGFTGCFVEASGVGDFARSGDRQVTGGAGAGCDYALRGFVIGAIGRFDFGSDTAAEIAARAGIQLNPSVLAYGLAAWRFGDVTRYQDGQLLLGAGIETYIPVDRATIFVEGTTSAAKAGAASTDDITVRGGVRYRF